MAGIYIHIPFCRRACHYCDFHFTTNLSRSTELVDAILKEILLRKDYLETESISTIYFGGGTPSLLPTADIERILNAIGKHHSIDSELELTLEANPEDLSKEKLQEFSSVGVNRLSLGTQSFIDSELKWMNRMHTANQTQQAISNAKNAGFNNISIDLIFGLPNQSEADWELNLKTAIELDVEHISSYSLTVEPKTVLNNNIKKGIQQPPIEEDSARFFLRGIDALTKAGFDHYEISNYAKPNHLSRHNSSYWHGAKYLGLGPSAHSYNGGQRQWNVRSNSAYISKVNGGESFQESENLSPSDKVNEHILTGLRTKWGIQKSILSSIDGNAWDMVKQSAEKLQNQGLRIDDHAITLTKDGMLVADNLTASLFI